MVRIIYIVVGIIKELRKQFNTINSSNAFLVFKLWLPA